MNSFFSLNRMVTFVGTIMWDVMCLKIFRQKTRAGVKYEKTLGSAARKLARHFDGVECDNRNTAFICSRLFFFISCNLAERQTVKFFHLKL